jgi:hypothetical protein
MYRSYSFNIQHVGVAKMFETLNQLLMLFTAASAQHMWQNNRPSVNGIKLPFKNASLEYPI